MKIHLKTVDLAGLAGFEPTNTEVKAPDVDRFITTQKQFHIFNLFPLSRTRTGTESNRLYCNSTTYLFSDNIACAPDILS